MRKILLILLLFVSTAAAQENALDYIPDASKESIVKLNENLRRTSRTLQQIAGGISLSGSSVTGILPLSKGGTARALTDPNADRIYFWDDSAGQTDWLTVGSGLGITGTTLSNTAVDANTSNVLFSFAGNGTYINGQSGFTASTVLNAAPTGFAYWTALSDGFQTLIETKVKKLSTFSTVTIYALVTVSAGTGTIQVDIGGATGSTTMTSTTPVWVNFTVDVSGLTTGSVYDAIVQMKNSGATNKTCVISIIAFAS
jgi:hypothetical protein